MPLSSFSYASADGVKIAAYRWDTAGEPRAAVELTHGNAAFQPARTDFDWLSRDGAVVDAYVADPRCGFGIDTGSAKAMFAGARRLADPVDHQERRRMPRSFLPTTPELRRKLLDLAMTRSGLRERCGVCGGRRSGVAGRACGRGRGS
jgi:alpha-beta hydrolase superfamily lysophospholipase